MARLPADFVWWEDSPSTALAALSEGSCPAAVAKSDQSMLQESRFDLDEHNLIAKSLLFNRLVYGEYTVSFVA